MRIGAKKRPFYRVVVVDERRKRTGGYLDLLGTYNPLTQPKEIKLNQPKIDEWIQKGAQMSDGFLRIISRASLLPHLGKAPQKPPRKPRNDKGGAAATPASTPQAPESTATSSEPETSTEETAADSSEAPAAPVEDAVIPETAESSEAPVEEAVPESEPDIPTDEITTAEASAGSEEETTEEEKA